MEEFFQHKYFNTYYYANIVSNVLSGDIELIGFISNFFNHEYAIYYLAKSFQKKSVFHSFIAHIVMDFFLEDMANQDSKNFEYYKLYPKNGFAAYADEVLKEYCFSDYSFDGPINDYLDIENYHNEIHESGILEDLFSIIADEIFYLMFNNRDVLLKFNYVVMQHMDDVNLENVDDDEIEELKKLFKKSGTLKRVRIPEWCKKAVYFRDRGKCCLCHKDLSGNLSITNKKHYDHIVPLAEGGLNDVANIQLLCSDCNLGKSSQEIITSNEYERWF